MGRGDVRRSGGDTGGDRQALHVLSFHGHRSHLGFYLTHFTGEETVFQRSSAASPAQLCAGTYIPVPVPPSPVMRLTSCPRQYTALQGFCWGWFSVPIPEVEVRKCPQVWLPSPQASWPRGRPWRNVSFLKQGCHPVWFGNGLTEIPGSHL